MIPTVSFTEENYKLQISEIDVIEEKTFYEETLDKQILQDIIEDIIHEGTKDSNKIIEINYKNALKDLGYYKEDHHNEEINMRNAVLRFQSDHNLNVDGYFGNESMQALEKRFKMQMFVFSDIIDAPPTESEWIVINKTKRILTLYKGKEVMKKYPIAQGINPSYTPEGKFAIVTKLINPRWGGAGIAEPVAGGSSQNPLGYRWLGISYKGGGSIGIHGNNNPTSIGTDASLGCIRMINSDVEELYELVQLHIPVWIGSNEQLLEWEVDNKSFILE